DSYKKLLEAVVEVHGDRPPRSLWYDLGPPTVDQEEVRLSVENWKPLLLPGYHSISDRAQWFRYMC
uniref:COesterase domain-containing protein n=1 Tax=Steinernema glaseri TaxID=37863 RepID=A0A1I8ANE6_9BILA